MGAPLSRTARTEFLRHSGPLRLDDRTPPLFPRDYKTPLRRTSGPDRWFRLAAWAVMLPACLLLWVHGMRWLVRWLAQ